MSADKEFCISDEYPKIVLKEAQDHYYDCAKWARILQGLWLPKKEWTKGVTAVH